MFDTWWVVLYVCQQNFSNFSFSAFYVSFDLAAYCLTCEWQSITLFLFVVAYQINNVTKHKILKVDGTKFII